jgi:hypothetical protein
LTYANENHYHEFTVHGGVRNERTFRIRGDAPNPEYLCRVVTRQNQRREAAVRAAQAMQRIVEQ